MMIIMLDIKLENIWKKNDFEEVYLLWVSKEDPAVGGERQRGVIDGLFSCGKEPTEVIETSFFMKMRSIM